MSDLAKCRMCGHGTIDYHFFDGPGLLGYMCRQCGHFIEGDEAAWNADAAKIEFPLAPLTVGEWKPVGTDGDFHIMWSNGNSAGYVFGKDENDSGEIINAKVRPPDGLVCKWAHDGEKEDWTGFATAALAQQWCREQLLAMCVEQRRKLEASK